MRVMFVLAAVLLSSMLATAAEAPTKHPVVTTTQEFYAAVDAGDFDRASKLVVPERYPKEKLQKMRELLRVDQAKVTEAHVGKGRAAVVTDEIAPREEGQGRKGRWGVSLRKSGDVWLIKDFDFLPTAETVETYLAKFHEVEPDAEKVAAGE